MRAIRTLRETAGLVQKDLAAMLGVTRQTVAAWESGRAWPNSELLPELTDILECSLEDLYAGDDPEDPSAAPQDDSGGRTDAGPSSGADAPPSPQGEGFDKEIITGRNCI